MAETPISARGLRPSQVFPEDEAAVGRQEGRHATKSTNGGDGSQAAMIAAILGDELILRAEALNRAFIADEEQADGTEPGEDTGGVDSSPTAFFGSHGEAERIVHEDTAIFADHVDAAIIGHDGGDIGGFCGVDDCDAAVRIEREELGADAEEEARFAGSKFELPR